MNDEKIANTILGIFVCFVYLFIALFTFFIIALARVEALDINRYTFRSTTSNYGQLCNVDNEDMYCLEDNQQRLYLFLVYPFQKDYTYSVSFSVSVITYSKFGYYVGTGYNTSFNDFNSNWNGSVSCTLSTSYYGSGSNEEKTMKYVCSGTMTPKENYPNITWAMWSNSKSDYVIATLDSYNIDLVNIDTSGNIINNNNANTDKVINNNNENTNKIIEAQEKFFEKNLEKDTENTQEIIDNQNKNNQELKDTIDNSFNKCHTSNNLINVNQESYSLNGVSVTNNNDGTYTLNGTTTTSTYLYLMKNNSIALDSGSYTGSVFANLPVGSSFYIRQASSTYYLLAKSDTKQTTINLDNSYTFDNVYIYAKSGVTFNNLVVKPFLTKGTSLGSFEKYGEICVNRQDETNEKLDGINGSLTDSNTDESTSTLGGFFDSFNDEDHGGISGIITAPLIAINKMLSKECTDLTSSYQDKEFSIPSGCQFWSRIKSVQDFLNVVEGGLLCYLIIRQMFYLVQSLKNPEDDRVEVMAL